MGIYVCLFISLILLGFVSVWLCISIRNYMKLQNQYNELKEIYEFLKNSNKEKSTEYSNKILEYIRMLVGQIAMIKFRTYEDGHQFDKTTKANIEKLITEIANSVHESLNRANISFDDTLFKEDFLNDYIIQTTIIVIKDMLEKAVDNYE